MKTAGIICEYNPFHKGHAYHITETRRMLGEDCAVFCVMSGNFTQRGDFAMINKLSRAKAAVLSGADLVAELPLPWALSSAEGFARGGVSLLEASGVCSHISFGSECGEINALSEAANMLLSPQLDAIIRQKLQSGISYASARQRAVEELSAESALLLGEPNNILGIEYLKTLRKLESGIVPITVKRSGAGHDAAPRPGQLPSAAHLRAISPDSREFAENVPESAMEIYAEDFRSGGAPVLMKNCELALLSRLRAFKEDDFADLPDGSEGLYMRFMKFARTDPDIESILVHTKTKRYAMSRIRRMLLCACLGIKASDAQGCPPYLRVLAFNDKGRKLLGEIGSRSPLPIISRSADAKALGPEARHIFELEAASTDLWALACPQVYRRSAGQEWQQSPVYMHIC
ncbi:MAG: nucleotidyltransferase family protein [Oscillospiraceae bacterium]|nr:nucleotidyltransferase family protein [Oscillospiraceae bacterium]